MAEKSEKETLIKTLENLETEVREFLEGKKKLDDKKLKEKINVLKELIGEVSEKDEKTKVAAHDLRNVLQSVYSLMNLSERSNVLGEDTVKEIKKAVKKIPIQLHEIREGLEKDYYPTKENIAELINQEVDRAKSIHKSIQIEMDLDNIEHEVDKYAFKSMIRNLLTNSIQNMLENDTPNKKIKIILKDMKDYILIIHEDTGTGIPEGVDPFAGKSTRKEGTGTGGKIIKWVVDSHGGEIQWENKEDGGVKFTIKLPKRRRPK